MSIKETSTYYVTGTDREDVRWYFTGREGENWLSLDCWECFTQFSLEQAKAWVRTFDALKAHHGITFHVERAR